MRLRLHRDAYAGAIGQRDGAEMVLVPSNGSRYWWVG